MINCPKCGSNIIPHKKLCPNCKETIDPVNPNAAITEDNKYHTHVHRPRNIKEKINTITGDTIAWFFVLAYLAYGPLGATGVFMVNAIFFGKKTRKSTEVIQIRGECPYCCEEVEVKGGLAARCKSLPV